MQYMNSIQTLIQTERFERICSQRNCQNIKKDVIFEAKKQSISNKKDESYEIMEAYV